MRIYYEKGDKVVHVKRGTIHTITHEYIGGGIRGEQMIAVDGAEDNPFNDKSYILSRNYRPIEIKVGKTLYIPAKLLPVKKLKH